MQRFAVWVSLAQTLTTNCQYWYSLSTPLKKQQYYSHFAVEGSEVQKFDLSTGHTRNLCQRWVCLSPYLLPQAQNYYYYSYLYITINVYGILQTDKVTGTAELTLSIIKPSFCPWWWIWGEEAFYFCSNVFSTFWNLNLNFSCRYFFLSTSLNT